MSSSIAHKTSLIGRTLVVFGLLALGCATTPSGATEANLARARTDAASGASTFAGLCSQCHGARGEGLGSAPPVLGAGALPEYPRSAGGSGDPSLIDPQQLQIQMQTRPAGAPSRDPFRNAQDLYRFVRTQMPQNKPGSLRDDEAWAVVNFLLAAQGTTLPPGGINPANASSTPVPHI